jgi:hypothetical protein
LIENCRGLVGFCTSGWWEVKSARTLVSS